MIYFLYDENDRLLGVEYSPVAAEIKAAEIKRTEKINVYIEKEEK